MENTRAKKEDRRVRYTKQAIRDGFLQLLREKPIEKISVTEICRVADINRGTFYAHYSGPYDLREKLEKELVDVLENRMQEIGATRLSSAQVLRQLREHKELCMVFYGPYGDQEAMMRIVSDNADRYLAQETEFLTHLSDQTRECLKNLLVASIATVFKYWLDTDMQAEPEDVANVLDMYCTRGLFGFMKNDK